MTNKRKDYYLWLLPYLLGFAYFSYIFIRIPVVSDRWWSEFVYDMEDTWRIVFSQIYWAKYANGRILSTLFAMIVDRNNYVRGLINAAMLMSLCCLFVMGLPSKASEKRKGILSWLSVGLMALMSFQIESEVYLYSTTLYISSALLVVSSIVLMIRSFHCGKENQTRFYTFYVLLLIISSLWLENVSCVLVGINILNTLYLYFKEHNLDKKGVFCTIISIGGMLFLYICMKNAADWRFNGVYFQKYSVEDIAGFVSDNIAIFVIFTILVYILSRQAFKESLLAKMVCVFFYFIIVLESILGLSSIYKIVAADYNMSMPFLWVPMKWNVLENIFVVAQDVFVYAIIPICIFLFLVLFVSLYQKDELMQGGIITIALGCAFVFQILYGKGQGRIESLSVFMLIFLCIFIGKTVEFGKNTFMKVLFAGIMVVAFINFDSLYIFTYNQAKLEDERKQITELVRSEQLLGRWDYNEVVALPAYQADSNGRRLFIFTTLQEGDIYLEGVKRWYGLDSRTKILYK